MSLKTISLHSFISVASQAFVPTINMIMGHQKQFFNLSDRRVKELFFYEIERILNAGKYGHKVIVINSCLPINNWRGAMNMVFPYELVDYELATIITPRKLYDTLESFWKLLAENPSYITIRNKELDSDDLEDVVMDVIGRSHIRLKRLNYNNIKDLNSYIDDHNRHKNQVPDYLKREVVQELRNKNLLA